MTGISGIGSAIDAPDKALASPGSDLSLTDHRRPDALLLYGVISRCSVSRNMRTSGGKADWPRMSEQLSNDSEA
jgi:hypothetical protein